jgi:hypothetical protein
VSVPFVSLDDLSAYLKTTLEASDLLAVAALDTACQAIRTYTNQELNLVRHDVVTVDGTWRRDLLLPQLPVLEVHAVNVTYADETVILDVDDLYLTPAGRLFILATPWYWRPGFGNVEVEYSHGWGVTEEELEESGEPTAERMPSDLRMVALRIAANLYNSPATTSIRQETLGSYSYTVGDDMVGMVEPALKLILDRYTIRKVPVA